MEGEKKKKNCPLNVFRFEHFDSIILEHPKQF